MPFQPFVGNGRWGSAQALLRPAARVAGGLPPQAPPHGRCASLILLMAALQLEPQAAVAAFISLWRPQHASLPCRLSVSIWSPLRPGACWRRSALLKVHRQHLLFRLRD